MTGRREGTLRESVLHNLRDLHAMAVENPVLPGTPDVECLGVWIELKSLERWPKRPDTLIRMEHWTPQQRVWHLRRAKAGGISFVLLEVCEAREFLLLDGALAVRYLGRSDRETLRAASRFVWSPKSRAMEGLRALVLSPPNVARALP